MNLLRSALFNLWFYALTAVLILVGLGLLCLPRGPAQQAAPPRWPEWLVRVWGRAALAGARWLAGIRYEVSGAENLPPGPVVLASMHQSAFDTLVWQVLLPHPAYVLKRELTRIPGFGPLSRQARMIVVDRGGGARALRGLLHGAERAAAEGRAIVIFPEGTRVAPGRRAPLHPGVAALAARIAVPVVPVATDSGRCWGRRAFRKRPGVIHIRILPPLAAGLARPALMARLEAAFAEGTAALGQPWQDVDNSVGSGAADLRPHSSENS